MDAPDDRRGFLHQLRLRRVFQHAVVITHPDQILFGRAEFRFRRLFLGLADSRQALRSHFQIIRTLVVIRVEAHENFVVIPIEQGDSSAGSEQVVIRVRSEQQNRLVAHFFQARLLRSGCCGGNHED